MRNRTRFTVKIVALASIGLLALTFSEQAFASGAVEIGGRTAVSASFGVLTQDPDKENGVDFSTTSLNIGAELTRTTKDGRWELGAGLRIDVVVFEIEIDDLPEADSKTTITLFTPSAQVRINSDLLGPEENFLVYAGFIAGVTVADYEAFEDEVGAFGPKFGAEYYFSPNVAVQLQDALLFDTNKGVTNSLTLGIKVLF